MSFNKTKEFEAAPQEALVNPASVMEGGSASPGQKVPVVKKRIDYLIILTNRVIVRVCRCIF
ncbi:MAG: hypothetical protein K2Y09_09115 [Nitrosomonas sp.]|uniref:hypothetical protein n=1 Tax=Nitrosomonas sp. TaxID=42353 RepID=UPI001D3DEAA2|nr:hypothetical protein [Nitrosomonas sp.]MBX9895324.1 hypothetical protein [Nitrosomonas sp.]